MTAQVVVAIVVASVVLAGLYVWYAAMLARVLPRLGAAAWRGWVPFVNEAEILHLGGYPRWAIVFLLVPVVNLCGIVLRAIAAHRMGARLGHGGGATALAVLLPPVWATVLAVARETTPQVAHRVAAEPLLVRVPGTGEAVVNGPVVNGPAVRSPVPTVDPAAAAPAPAAAAAPAPLPVPVPVPVPTVPAPVAVPTAPPPTIVAPAWNAPADLDPVPSPTVAALIAPPPTAAGSRPTTPDPVASRFAPPGASPRPLLPPREPDPEIAPALELEPDPDPEPGLAPVEPQLEPEPWDEDDDGETIVVDRRPVARWELVLDDGPGYALVADSVVLGRRPAGTDAATQYLAVRDTTRTLSKVHARLDLQGDDWRIIDLRSTNGVLVVDDDGAEHALDPGSAVLLDGRRFVLGRVAMRVQRTGDGARIDRAGS